MREIFLRVVYLGEVGSYLMLAVIAARLILWKAPKNSVCLLWLLVAVRLAIPFSVESAYSVIPSQSSMIPETAGKEVWAETTGREISDSMKMETAGGDTVIDARSEEAKADKAMTGTEMDREKVVRIAMWIWLVGMAFMSGYFVLSYLKLNNKVSTAVPVVICGEKVYRSDNIESPFLLGVFRPRIYVPGGMEEEILSYAIAHEKAHLKRRDDLTRLAGCLFLIVYWFHPLVWVSYVLSGRDMEYACDERVIGSGGADFKKGYARALLSCLSTGKKMIRHRAAFGEVGGKKRIMKILNYKKPAFWGVAAVITAALFLVICFMSNKKEEHVIYYDGAEITFVEGVFCPELGSVSLVFNVDRNGYDGVNKVVLGGKATTGKTVAPSFIGGDITQEGMNEVTFWGDEYQNIGDEFVILNNEREEIGVFKTTLIKQEKAVHFEAGGQSDKVDILVSPHFMEAEWESGFPGEASVLVMKTKQGEDIVVFPITHFSGMEEANERISQLGYHAVQSKKFVNWDENGVLKITFSELVSVENIQSFEVVSL